MRKMKLHKHGDVEVVSRVGDSVYYHTIGEWSTSYENTYTYWKRIPINMGMGRRSLTLVKTVKAAYKMNESDWDFVNSHKDSTTWLNPEGR